MGFNPKTQQKIKIPAKTVVKFRVAKAAKDGVLQVKKVEVLAPILIFCQRSVKTQPLFGAENSPGNSREKKQGAAASFNQFRPKE